MLITYKVLEEPTQVEENHWDVLLTDLNSNGAFKIKVRLAQTFGNQATGLVIEGPDTYQDRILTVAILAGYSLTNEGKEFVDVSGISVYRHKKLCELTKEDRLIDVVAPA